MAHNYNPGKKLMGQSKEYQAKMERIKKIGYLLFRNVWLL